MKKFVAFLLVALTAIGTYSAVTGKSEQNNTNQKPALCFVVEADDLFGFNFNEFSYEIKDVVSKYGYIRAVCADGRPFVYVDIDVPMPEKRYTKAKQRRMNESITNEIIAMLNDVSPKTPENDLLGAIKNGKQILNRCRDATSRDMIVISSGISRAGILRFQDYSYDSADRRLNVLLTTTPEKIVAQLTSNNAIPDLSNLDALIWYGCGATPSEGNQKIPDSASIKIQDLWACITEEAGCPAEFLDISLSDIPFDTDLNSTVIDFGEDKIDIDPPEIDIKFNESQLGFIPNEAVLRDDETAKEMLEPYAQSLIEYAKTANRDEPILYIVGLTATFGDPERCEKLSLERAEKVKQLLVAQGCPTELIGTLGLGQGGPDSMRTNDTIQTDDLTTLEALRAANRVVYLIGANSPKAELLGLY